jgi:hypothetical protein
MTNEENQYAAWCQCTPKDADIDDVRRLALYFLGADNVREGTRGSHVLIIDGPVTRLACRVRDEGWGDLAWLQGSSLSISIHSGKKVKSVYVKQLIKLIAFKLQAFKTTNPKG